MTKTTTYRELMSIVEDINQQNLRSPAFEVLHGARARWFMEKNSARIQAMHKFNWDAMQVHAKLGDDGKPTMIQNEQGQTVLAFDNDEKKAAYIALFQEFMGRSIDIYL